MIARKIIGKLLFFCLIFQFLLVKQQFLVKKHFFSQLMTAGKVTEQTSMTTTKKNKKMQNQ